MTLNNFLQAIAAKLTGLWPDRLVDVEKIPQGADGNFFVGIIESDQAAGLDRRRRRVIQFEVLYFLRSDENMAFNDWAESMYDHFGDLTVEEAKDTPRLIHLTNQKARRDDDARVFQFLFDADFYFVSKDETTPCMEVLDLTEGIK